MKFCLGLYIWFGAMALGTLQAASIPLLEAVSNKKVELKASSPGSYSRLAVKFKNCTQENLIIDTFGTLFLPQDGESQRLGVARVSIDKETTELALKPGEEKEVVFPTFCLDHARPGPSSNAGYTLAQEGVPQLVKTAFEYWNKLPEADQHLIQGAIWSGDLAGTRQLIEAMEKEIAKLVRPELVVTVQGDFVLKQNGQLLLASADAKPAEGKLLAEKVCRIFKCSGNLVAIRIEGKGLTAERYENGAFKPLGRLPFLPSLTIQLKDGKWLYADKEWLYLPNQRMVRFKASVLRLIESDPGAARECWLLSADQRLFKLNTDNGLPISFDQPYDDMATSAGLKVFRKGRSVELSEHNLKGGAISLPFDCERLQTNGRCIAMLGDHGVWTVKNGKAEKVAGLDQSPISMDMAGDGSAHVLLENGTIKKLNLPKQPALKLELPNDGPADAGSTGE